MTVRDQLCAIAVMAKAPLPGRVKTRLVPPLSADEAMALSASFLRDITENIARAARHGPIHSFVAYAPAGHEARFDGLVATETQLVLADGSCDMPPGVVGIGRSLLHAAESLFSRGYGSVCLLNADSPTLPATILGEAAAALAAPGDRVVLGPAEDGGYYLIGIKAPHRHLFEDIRWSTAHVAAETRARAVHLGLDIVTLPSWYDVDDQESLSRLIGELSKTGGFAGDAVAGCPATAACIARLGLSGRLMGAAPGQGVDAGSCEAMP